MSLYCTAGSGYFELVGSLLPLGSWYNEKILPVSPELFEMRVTIASAYLRPTFKFNS